MKNLAVTEILNKHAEALNAERGAEFLAEHPGRDEMAGLFDVAGRLKSALRPVTPRPEFVAHLKQRLVRESWHLREREEEERRQQMTWLAIGAGSVLYSFGLVAMGVRSTWWFIGLAALALGWRKRSELLKVRQAVRR